MIHMGLDVSHLPSVSQFSMCVMKIHSTFNYIKHGMERGPRQSFQYNLGTFI